MKHLDLFSGIGGFALAARRVGWQTIQFVEIEPYCQRVLAKNFPGVPIHDDIQTYTGAAGSADIITAGFPCQPSSQIGLRKGEQDDRWLWPYVPPIIETVGPTWFVGENVIGLADMGLDQVLADLANLDYSVGVYDIPAGGVGANHERRRLWILAHTNSEGLERQPSTSNAERTATAGHDWSSDRWMPTPRICRGSDGIPNRVDRIKGLGNAIVPQVAESLFRAIDLN